MTGSVAPLFNQTKPDGGKINTVLFNHIQYSQITLSQSKRDEYTYCDNDDNNWKSIEESALPPEVKTYFSNNNTTSEQTEPTNEPQKQILNEAFGTTSATTTCFKNVSHFHKLDYGTTTYEVTFNRASTNYRKKEFLADFKPVSYEKLPEAVKEKLGESTIDAISFAVDQTNYGVAVEYKFHGVPFKMLYNDQRTCYSLRKPTANSCWQVPNASEWGMIPREHCPLPSRQELSTLIGGYKHATLSGKGRTHRFFSAKHKALNPTGDLLKTLLLLKLRQELIEGRKAEELRESDDYKTLKSGQGIATRLFGLKTSSMKAFEQMAQDYAKNPSDEDESDNESLGLGGL